MELYSGSLYWPGTSPYYYLYPVLGQSIQTEAAIIGSGVAGILCGYLLAKSGIDTVVAGGGEIGGGAAAADTGIVQFSGDMMLSDLIDGFGERGAVRLYAACRHAVEHLGIIAGGLGRDVGFKRRSSLNFAPDKRQLNRLEREFRALRTYGFDVEYWSSSDISARFPFERPAAIVTHGDAELNPYLFVHETASAAIAAGLQVYQETAITACEAGDGGYKLRTAGGHVIEARYVIQATGSAPADVCALRMQTLKSRRFAVVTGPQMSLAEWHQRFILREMSVETLALRTTPDGRIIACGQRELADGPLPSGRAEREPRIAAILESVRRLFPDCRIDVAHEWCAGAGESRDRLPYIGEDPDRPGVFYSLGCGGNGIVYAMLAAQIIRDRLQGERHPAADLLRLGRPSLAGVF